MLLKWLTKEIEMKTFSLKMSLRKEEARRRESKENEEEDSKLRRWKLIT